MPALSAIQDVDARDWVTGEAITPSKLERDFAKFKIAVNLILAYLRERELNFASSSEPNDINNGQLWYDLGNALLKIRRSGVWEQVLTESTIKDVDLAAGGGTDTFNQMGSVNNDSSDVSITFNSPELGIQYAVPANTLSSDGDVLMAIGAFTQSVGTSKNCTFQFGSSTDDNQFQDANSVDWIAKAFLVRTSSGAQKFVSVMYSNYDDQAASGSIYNKQVDTGTFAEDETTQNVLGYTKFTGGAEYTSLWLNVVYL